MLSKILAAIGVKLVEKLASIFMEWMKEKNEERKTINDVKAKVQQLKNVHTVEEIRAALRNLNP